MRSDVLFLELLSCSSKLVGEGLDLVDVVSDGGVPLLKIGERHPDVNRASTCMGGHHSLNRAPEHR